MKRRIVRRTLVTALALAAVAVPAASSAPPVQGRSLPAGTHFLVPPANRAAADQIRDLKKQHREADAKLIERLVGTPQAVWLDGGSPREVEHAVHETLALAHRQHAVPVFVAYNIPGRDCSNLSAGGAQSEAEYDAWIDAIAHAIGHNKAVVILEPDSLGLLPEGCDPGAGVTQTNAERYRELNYAVDALEAKPNTAVYLDATHPAWLAVGDAAQRLVAAGVGRAQGFFLNVSNYQYTENDVAYGTWVSSCIDYATRLAPGDFGSCPNQYWDGGPATNWDGDALDRYQVWRDVRPYSGDHADLRWNIAGIDSRWTDVVGAVPTTHFVVDTSRNGLGPWQYSGYPNDGVAQDWCNPPGRGAGPRPQAQPLAGNPLVDAYLWIKVPGESDGQCTRGTSGGVDPEWGMADPPAGQWFPQEALQLARLAQPAL